MRFNVQTGHDESESGFMLLTVVVMCALVLIALAAAAPVIAKDIRRDKEVESVHRAQQYVRAIQLFQRQCKCTAYPPSMEALEKTNNVRFLRQQYIDPLTGKSDWRIIHVPKTTVKGFFGQELQGLAGGLGSAAGLASGATSSTTTISSGGLAGGFNGASFQTGASGSTGSSGSAGSTSAFGDGSGGVIMGVGTARTGESILTPNQQLSYETWEFWYDPRIELLKKNVNILGGGGGLGTGAGSSTSKSLSDLNNLNGPSGSSGPTGNTGNTGSR